MHQKVGDAPRASHRDVVFDHVSICRAQACNGTGNESRMKRDCSTRVRDLHSAAIRDCFEESQERDFVGCETGVCRRRASDFGNVHGSAAEGGNGEPAGKCPVPCKSQELGRGVGHGLVCVCVFLSFFLVRNPQSACLQMDIQPLSVVTKNIVFCRSIETCISYIRQAVRRITGGGRNNPNPLAVITELC